MDKSTFELVAKALESRRESLANALRDGARLPIEALRNSARVLARSPNGTLSLAISADTSTIEEKDCGVVVDETKMSASFPISTPRKDRMGDVVVPRGCVPHLKNYERNPRVFFAHKSDDLPIGSARHPDSGELALDISDNLLRSTCFFHGQTSESECVFRLVKRKELQATSIGFLPVVASIINDDEDEEKSAKKTEDGERIVKFGGFLPLRFLEWDLTEWSIVPVPANPDACESLSAHLSRGHVEGEKLPYSLRKALEPFKLKARVWSQGFNPETTKYSGTLVVGESEMEYEAGKLVRIDEVKLLKAPSPDEPLDVPEQPVAQEQPTTFVLTAESLTAIVEKAVGDSLAKLKLSAGDDTAGGATVPSEPSKDVGELKACVAELEKQLKAHIDTDMREHKEILAAVNELRAACETERSFAKRAEEAHVAAVKNAADSVIAGLAATNDLVARRIEDLTGRRHR